MPTSLTPSARPVRQVLYARYDLERARHTLTPESLARRRWDMWRYQEVLPVRDPANIVSLGEGMTPLVPAALAGEAIGAAAPAAQGRGEEPDRLVQGARVWAARSHERHELGVTAIALPSAGNAASAPPRHTAAAAGLEVNVFMPRDVPETNRVECLPVRRQRDPG